MFEALEDTIRAKDNRLAELRDILLGPQKPGFRELYPVRFPWLNSTQETAVNKVLCTRDVSIVHGPPGTERQRLLSKRFTKHCTGNHKCLSVRKATRLSTGFVRNW